MNAGLYIQRSTLVFFLFSALFLFAGWAAFHGESIATYVVSFSDELHYIAASHNLMEAIQSLGLLAVLPDFYQYTHSLHSVSYFINAYVLMLAGDSLFGFFLFKAAVYILGCRYFAKFIAIEANYPRWGSLYCVILMYMPLVVFTFSFLRDPYIFFMMSGALYYFRKGRLTYSAIFLLLLFGTRLNAGLAVVAYIGCHVFLSRGMTRGLRIIAIVFLLAIFLAVSTYYSSFSVNLSTSPAEIVRNLIRAFLSPLPWSLDPELPLPLRYWYSISFLPACFLYISGMLLAIKYGLRKLFSLPLLVLIGSYIVGYAVSDLVGFRQVSIIRPFIYFPILCGLLNLIARRGIDGHRRHHRASPLESAEAVTVS